MGNSYSKISLITANLPCRIDLGPIWCTFNLTCEQGKETEFLERFRRDMGDYAGGDNRVVYLAEGYETDTVETMTGEEAVSIFTVFLSVGPLTYDKAQALNATLVDLYGTAPDDLQSMIRELAVL